MADKDKKNRLINLARKVVERNSSVASGTNSVPSFGNTTVGYSKNRIIEKKTRIDKNGSPTFPDKGSYDDIPPGDSI